MALQITTNHNKRLFTYRHDVPEEIQKNQFDYQDPEENHDGFFKFKGHWYHLDQFMRIDPQAPGGFQKWHGYHADSFYSGVLIQVSDDGETYKVATYIQKYGD